MLSRPYSIQNRQRSIDVYSPTKNIKPQYIRLKSKNDKKQKSGGRSLCTIDNNKNSIVTHRQRILSHRKLISVSQLQNKQNLTERKNNNENQGSTNTNNTNVRSKKNILEQIYGKGQNSNKVSSSKKNLHLNKFTKYRNDRLNTIDNQETQVKERLIQGCIAHLQQVLKQLGDKKSNKQTIASHRLKTQTAKKTYRNPLQELNNNNDLTINVNCQDEMKVIQNDKQKEHKNFKAYLDQVKNTKSNKQNKMILIKNKKKSMKNMSLSRLGGETQIITSRIDKAQSRQQNNLNLKNMFKNIKKYQPYLNHNSSRKSIRVANSESELLKCQIMPIKQERCQQLSPTQKINRCPPEVDIECSSIQQINQSSFISEAGKKSLLKQFQKKLQCGDIKRSSSRKGNKYGSKLKANFPNDFF